MNFREAKKEDIESILEVISHAIKKLSLMI